MARRPPGPIKYKVSLGLALGYGAVCGVIGAEINQYVLPFFFGRNPSEESAFQDGPCTKRGKDILKYGTPESAPKVTYYRNHSLHYDQAKKTPSWVAEHLTHFIIRGKASRKLSDYAEDEEYDEVYRSKASDYLDSGWTKGHVAPPGDNKHDQLAMDSSFLMSNVLPQNKDNYSGFWNRFEMYCRDLTNKYQDVRVISGPLILPTGEEKVKVKAQDGSTTTVSQKFVKYPVIGESEVAVPTHLYKLIVADPEPVGSAIDATPSHVAAFIVPNEPLARESSLREYQVPVETLEAKAGFNFTPSLDKKKAQDLCESEGCQLMAFDKFQKYYIQLKMKNASSLDALEKAWKELSKSDVNADNELYQVYENKKTLLSQRE